MTQLVDREKIRLHKFIQKSDAKATTLANQQTRTNQKKMHML